MLRFIEQQLAGYVDQTWSHEEPGSNKIARGKVKDNYQHVYHKQS